MKKLMLLAIVVLAGCQEDSKFQEAQLLGHWNAIAWNNKTDNTKIDAKVDFTFEKDQRYIAKLGNSSEKGKYWIAGGNLHTIEDGKAEKKVKITKLVQDTLIFEMNRVGTIEEMILLRDK